MRGLFLLSVVMILTVSCQPQGSQQPDKAIIVSPDAPAAIGPYSQAIKAGNTLYCSGQIAIDPATNQMVTETIEAETEQVLKNLGAVLKAAGMDYSDVVSATVYMTDIQNYSRINSVYAKYFSTQPPARAAVQVANLPKNANVEIACIAVKAR